MAITIILLESQKKKRKNTYPRLFGKHGVHVLIGYGWHYFDICIITFYPLFVHWNVLCVK